MGEENGGSWRLGSGPRMQPAVDVVSESDSDESEEGSGAEQVSGAGLATA